MPRTPRYFHHLTPAAAHRIDRAREHAIKRMIALGLDPSKQEDWDAFNHRRIIAKATPPSLRTVEQREDAGS